MTGCPHCSSPLSAGVGVCPSCGRACRAVRARAERHEILCPRCPAGKAGPFKCDVVLLGPARLDLCRRCKGLWFDSGELKQFEEALADPVLNAQVLEVLRELGARSAKPPEEGHAACPVCSLPMNRINFAKVSGIMVETCPTHGAWAPHAAALRLVELFGGGGAARLREIAESWESARREQTLEKQRARIEDSMAIRKADAELTWHQLTDWFGLL